MFRRLDRFILQAMFVSGMFFDICHAEISGLAMFFLNEIVSLIVIGKGDFTAIA